MYIISCSYILGTVHLGGSYTFHPMEYLCGCDICCDADDEYHGPLIVSDGFNPSQRLPFSTCPVHIGRKIMTGIIEEIK